MRRKRSQSKKKPSAVETSPEALEETWKIVEEELKASGFQVSVRINLRGQQRVFIFRRYRSVAQEHMVSNSSPKLHNKDAL